MILQGDCNSDSDILFYSRQRKFFYRTFYCCDTVIIKRPRHFFINHCIRTRNCIHPQAKRLYLRTVCCKSAFWVSFRVSLTEFRKRNCYHNRLRTIFAVRLIFLQICLVRHAICIDLNDCLLIFAVRNHVKLQGIAIRPVHFL